jgi:hypothetical protein
MVADDIERIRCALAPQVRDDSRLLATAFSNADEVLSHGPIVRHGLL